MTKIPETTMNGDKMLLFIDQLIDLANFMKATEERWLGRGKIVNVFSEMLVSGNSDQQRVAKSLLLRADQNDGKSDQIVNLTNLNTHNYSTDTELWVQQSNINLPVISHLSALTININFYCSLYRGSSRLGQAWVRNLIWCILTC